MTNHKYALIAGLPILIVTGLSIAYGQTGSAKTPSEHRSGPPTDPYSQKVKNTSFTSLGGERVLRHELLIEASLEELWNAMTTEDGLKSFMVPTAKVELKTGGAWETNYRMGSRIGDPDNIRNQVLCYIPLEMLALKINLTAAFPEWPRNAGTLFAVLTLKQLEPKRVLVTESMLGWGQGPDWDKTYGFFEWGNAYTLGQLYKRFAEGPIDWTKRETRGRGDTGTR